MCVGERRDYGDKACGDSIPGARCVRHLRRGQGPIKTSTAVCSFYGAHGGGAGNYNKSESCSIPDIESLDTSYHQGDFNCCGGGATSPTTGSNIPAGLDVKVDGGYFWAVSNPRLSGSTFSIDTYCGPGPNGGPGCNVKVTVVAHYSIVPAPPPPPKTESATPLDKKSNPSKGQDPAPKQDPPTTISTDKILAFVFGVVFIVVLLLVAVFDRNPTPLAIFIYRVILALAAAGIGAVIPGMIDVNVAPVIRAGGAVALFIIIYWFRPADLVAQNPPPPNPPPPAPGANP